MQSKSIRILVVATVFALLSGVATPLLANPEKVKLKNGKTVVVNDGRVMTRGKDGKAKPLPKGTYETAGDRVLVVGSKGQLQSFGKKKGGGSGKVTVPDSEFMLKDGRRASTRNGRLYIQETRRSDFKKASKGTYKARDGRKIKVEGGGKIQSIKK